MKAKTVANGQVEHREHDGTSREAEDEAAAVLPGAARAPSSYMCM